MEARAASERCDRLAAKLKVEEEARKESEELAGMCPSMRSCLFYNQCDLLSVVGRCMLAEGERDQLRQEVLLRPWLTLPL